MKKLFITISERLKSEVPELRWIDADYGQTDNYEYRAKVSFPAVLISVGIKPEEQGGGSQLQNANIELKLLFNPATLRTEAHTADEIREQALQYYDTADKVYLALQGFQTDDYNTFECTSQLQENRSDGLLIVRLSFNTSFWDFRKTDN